MIQPKDFFILRQPTYPLSRLIQFYEQLGIHSLESLLRQHYEDPLAQEAIFAASPTLYERFSRWLAGETLPEHSKLITTLHKYFVRMCSRPTPYGLFAGCILGRFGEHTRLRAGTPATLRTHTRIDTDCLLAIGQWLTSQPVIRSQLRLFPNSSLYPVGPSLRYIEQQRESTPGDKDRRHYFISVVDADCYLTTLLTAARTGATIAQLTELLTTLDILPDEAADFVAQLIEGQLLIFEIEPTVTGLHYLQRLTERVAALTNAEEATIALGKLCGLLNGPDRLQTYAQTRQWFQDRAIQPPMPDVVQVDSFFDTSVQVSERAMQHLKRDLEKLLVLNQPNVCPDLDEFKRRFYNRYEDEEISLALALDGEFGIGYGSGSTLGVGYAPLIDDLTFATATAAPTTAWDWWQNFVMDKYANALRRQHAPYKDGTGPNDEIVLTDDDLTFIGSRQTASAPLPDSFYVFGSLLARSASAIDDGDFQFNLLACKGPSALNLLSRFGEGNPELADQIKHCAAAEAAQHPDVILAEIVHLPENRVGNILTRPTIHQYEIPYMGQSSVDPDHQIPLSDLLVSVRNDTLILRSKRLNKRVIPRLTNAHNFTQGLPIYRFLCELQAQDAHLNVAWNWGVLRNQTYLPRVRYRSVILSRATWQLDCRDLTPDNPLRLVGQLTAAGLPARFVLTQGDNELLVAMHVPASLDLLIAYIRKSQKIRLVEYLRHPHQCPLTDKREYFTHELIIPFRHNRAPQLPGLSQSEAELPQRRFSVGSEWFYLKVYTGEKTSDALLLQTIYPVVQQLLKTKTIEEFFFLRYKDTDPHLRLRFRGNAHLEFYTYVVRAMEKALHDSVEAGVVHRVQVDTYQREFERYGLEHIGLCESLFHCDSLSTLAFLSRTGEVFDENQRFAFAIRKIDRLLTGAALSPADCRTVLERLKESFFQEFGGDSTLRHQLNEKYRLYRPLMAQALSPNFPAADGLDDWNCTQTNLLGKLSAAFAENPAPLYGIISSLIHMIVNRLFPSKQRAYELVLYHCLAKHYDSVRARTPVSSVLAPV